MRKCFRASQSTPGVNFRVFANTVRIVGSPCDGWYGSECPLIDRVWCSRDCLGMDFHLQGVSAALRAVHDFGEVTVSTRSFFSNPGARADLEAAVKRGVTGVTF